MRGRVLNESNYKREVKWCPEGGNWVPGRGGYILGEPHRVEGGLQLTQSQWRRFCGAGRLLSADSSGSSAEQDLQLG